MADISFTDAAIDDLRHIGPDAVPKVLKKLLILLADPKAGYPLGGELTGYRKLVVGRNTWRIVYRIADDDTVEICEVWAVGARADAAVYAEAAARVRNAAITSPEFTRLANVLERLGRLTGDIAIEQSPVKDPVPDWLADRLVHTAGISRSEVAALNLEQAIDLWTEFVSKPTT